jgi:FKBP12-rapamycin complex-associated protein
MQLFDLVNTILSKDNDTNKKKLFIETYSVFPLSHNAGIIGWVPNCDTLHKLIKDERAISNTIPSVENRKVYKLYPRFETGHFLSKVETFKEGLLETHGTELLKVIWKKSKNCESWLNRRTNYSRSLAVMSMVGYILGLGDRHPSNLMMSRKTGKIIHIDFGDCFEVAMKRDKFPEKIPFRLTRMLIKALEVSGIEGTFRLTCIKIMELLRNNKDSLLAILSSFIHDPLISFRLMIPMIMKKRKRYNNEHISKKQKNINNINYEKDDDIDKINDSPKNDNSDGLNILSQSVKFNYGGSLRKLNELFKSYKEVKEKKENEKEDEKEEEKNEEGKNDEKIESTHEKKEKEEKKQMEEDERQIFNLFEEKDEIESEELNKIGQMVLDRIQDKLSGTDFYPDSVCDPKTQVDKLIIQATSFENLAQSYLGWCPFW